MENANNEQQILYVKISDAIICGFIFKLHILSCDWINIHKISTRS